ncbi:hypothetical protein Hanom_Chr16g01517081 [Helianthus anomalus]
MAITWHISLFAMHLIKQSHIIISILFNTIPLSRVHHRLKKPQKIRHFTETQLIPATKTSSAAPPVTKATKTALMILSNPSELTPNPLLLSLSPPQHSSYFQPVSTSIPTDAATATPSSSATPPSSPAPENTSSLTANTTLTPHPPENSPNP